WPVQVEVPITQRALTFIDLQLRGERVDLSLELAGRIFLCPPDDVSKFPSFRGAGWTSAEFPPGGGYELRLQVPRSDWFTQVLQPLGLEQYVPIEIRIPAGPFGQEFAQALAHVVEAERALLLAMILAPSAAAELLLTPFQAPRSTFSMECQTQTNEPE